MITFTCFVLEDIMEPGMYMAPDHRGPGIATFYTQRAAEDHLWSKDCLVAMGYAVRTYGIDESILGGVV